LDRRQAEGEKSERLQERRGAGRAGPGRRRIFIHIYVHRDGAASTRSPSRQAPERANAHSAQDGRPSVGVRLDLVHFALDARQRLALGFELLQRRQAGGLGRR
jgi:hypothetical protein